MFIIISIIDVVVHNSIFACCYVLAIIIMIHELEHWMRTCIIWFI